MDGSSITGLLTRWGEGNEAALAELAPQVHRELHALARSYLRKRHPNNSLQATALINEAWLRLIGRSQPMRWESRAHFYGIAARLMRIVLVDYMRSRNAAKRGGIDHPLTMSESVALSPDRPPDVLELSEALDELAKADDRKARVIELRYFGGMDREEISRALGVSLATVKRDLRLGEAWLRRFLRS
ncbi:MAG TPA: ECF-type sigma factor [Candidatus Acidoferrum sp.]|jgi:RNA polymerase sigma factor (TIGR02999 family)|nr:ECF-type sigma factor [Candidatus Acidoferrum sp.]